MNKLVDAFRFAADDGDGFIVEFVLPSFLRLKRVIPVVGEHGIDIFGELAGAEELRDGFDFVVANNGPCTRIRPPPPYRACLLGQQLFGALFVQDRATVDLGGDLEADPG